MGEATLVVARPKAYMDKVRSYRIMLDGQEIGRIKDGSEESLTIPAGQHELQLKIDWAVSPTATFNVGEGEIVRFNCKPKGNPLTALYYASFGRKNYIMLEPA